MSDFFRDPVQEYGDSTWVEFMEPRPVMQADFNLKSEARELVKLSAQTPVCVRLDLEDLPCFTVVERQYEALGVRFHNAIAIHPSNPAYSAHSGVMLLLAAPKTGWLEATFVRPVQTVSSFVSSSRRTVIRAFNRQNHLVAEAATEANIGQGSTNLHLTSTTQAIHRVTLESFNGQITVDDFCFCG